MAGRVLEPAVAALTAAAVVLVGRLTHVWEGPAAILLLGGLLLAVPTSRELSRRLLLAGCMALGWVPLLWWGSLPLGGLGRAGLLMAVTAAGLAAWVFAGPGRAHRARRLVPRVRVVDGLVLGAALLAGVLAGPWLRAGSADAALAMLMRGWDHSAHYDIVHMLREHGVVIGALGPGPLGDTWSYAQYPQGFHAVAATLMETLAGPVPGGPSAEVLRYGQSLGLVIVLCTVVLAAGVCALPRLRHRPWVAAPVVAVVSGAFLLGPGARMVVDGFPNFAMACALLACLPLLVLPLERGPMPVHLAAVGGAIVGIAHGWVLLLVMALPAVLLVLLPIRRRRFVAGWSAWAGSIGVVAATAAAVGVAVVMVAGTPITDVLVIPGAINAPHLRLLLGPAVLAVLVCAAVAVRGWLVPRRRRAGGARRSGSEVRTVTLMGIPAVGLAVAGGIALLQRASDQPLGYYFWKFAIAVAIVSLVCGAVAVTWLVPARLGTATASWRTWVAAGLATVAATQMYGIVAPGGARLAGPWLAPGLVARGELTASAWEPPVAVGQLWVAVEAPIAPDHRHVFLGHPPEGGASPTSVGQWYNALGGRWTDQSNELLKELLAPTTTNEETGLVATRVLTADPRAVVIVTPERLEDLRTWVPGDAAARLVSW